MRSVDLTNSRPARGPEEALGVQKRTGHLWARLMELEEDGLRVLSPTDPKDGAGQVRADVPNGDTAGLVRALQERWHVLCRLEGGAVCFTLGPDTTFEELDYVQDAVYRYLLHSS